MLGIAKFRSFAAFISPFMFFIYFWSMRVCVDSCTLPHESVPCAFSKHTFQFNLSSAKSPPGFIFLNNFTKYILLPCCISLQQTPVQLLHTFKSRISNFFSCFLEKKMPSQNCSYRLSEETFGTNEARGLVQRATVLGRIAGKRLRCAADRGC